MGKAKTHSFSGPSQRQLRVSALIRRTLSDIFLRGDLHSSEFGTPSITVTEVRVSPDLRQATVYFVPFGEESEERAREALRGSATEIRRLAAKKMALKYAPELRFHLDDRFDTMEQMNALLRTERVKTDLEEK